MAKDLNYPDLTRICRLCLKEEEVLVEIFPKNDKNSTTVKQLSIPMRIMACAAIEVQSSDDLPKCICPECRYQLEKYFYFRKRAQLSDNKLRKHLRLLGLGKKSAVFAKTAEDDEDVEELEFEDSLKFIREQEELRSKDTLNVMLTEKLVSLKKELEVEVQQKLEETWEKTKLHLRLELKEKCRQEELIILQNEMEQFFAVRRRIKVISSALQGQETLNSEKLSNDSEWLPLTKKKLANKTKNVTLNLRNMRNMRKRAPSVEVLKSKVAKIAKNNVHDKKSDIKIPTESSEEFEFIRNDDKVDDVAEDVEQNENDAQSNFYIIDKQTQEEPFAISEDSNQHDENSLSETALYQIEANGDIQTIESKDSMIFNIDPAEIDIGDDADDLVYQTCDIMEFVDVKHQKKTNQKKNIKHKITDTKECSIQKFKLEQPTINNNESINIDMVQEDNIARLKLPYSRTTDTPKIFKCELCPMSFSTENTYNRHYRTHEQSEKRGVKFTCSECNVVFSCKSALSRHAIIHTGERPYKCEECGKGFVQREILKRHMIVHTGARPCQCPYCPRAYTQKVNLNQHINQHHSKTPKVKQHQCSLCQKRFNHASGLSRHLTSHSGIHYQCMECDKKFSDKSSIKRHISMVHCKESAGELIKEHNTPLIDSKPEDNVAEI